MPTENKRLFIAHHETALGSALMRLLDSPLSYGMTVITAPPQALDWSCTAAIGDFLRRERPTHVVLPLSGTAMGGGTANRPGHELQRCMVGGMNLVEQAQRMGIGRLLVVGSACAYPADLPAPLAEEDLLTGRFNPVCEVEGVATVMLLKMCETYTRDFGRDRDFSYRGLLTDTPFGHVPPGSPQAQRTVTQLADLILEARARHAPELELPYVEEEREALLYDDDIAAAALFVLDLESHAYTAATARSRCFLNAGYGSDLSYGELARSIAAIVGYTGALHFEQRSRFQPVRPRFLDSHRLRSLGWQPLLEMREALALTCFHLSMQRLEAPARRRTSAAR